VLCPKDHNRPTNGQGEDCSALRLSLCRSPALLCEAKRGGRSSRIKDPATTDVARRTRPLIIRFDRGSQVADFQPGD
jgi:hypothetical protein